MKELPKNTLATEEEEAFFVVRPADQQQLTYLLERGEKKQISYSYCTEVCKEALLLRYFFFFFLKRTKALFQI